MKRLSAYLAVTIMLSLVAALAYVVVADYRSSSMIYCLIVMGISLYLYNETGE